MRTDFSLFYISRERRLYYGCTMAEIKYEIVQEICVLSESARGWTKELNLVSWNDREPKFDIREWAPEHSRMGKGVTLSKEEMQMILDTMANFDENADEMPIEPMDEF